MTSLLVQPSIISSMLWVKVSESRLSACQICGMIGNECALAFCFAAAAAGHVSYNVCIGALTPSDRSKAAGEFELLGGARSLGVLEWLV